MSKVILFSMCKNLPLPHPSGYDVQYNAMKQVWIYSSYLFSINTCVYDITIYIDRLYTLMRQNNMYKD